MRNEPHFVKLNVQPILLASVMEFMTKECEGLLLHSQESALSLRRKYPIEVFEVAQVRAIFHSPPSPSWTSTINNLYTPTSSPYSSHPGQTSPSMTAVNQHTLNSSQPTPQMAPTNKIVPGSTLLERETALPAPLTFPSANKSPPQIFQAAVTPPPPTSPSLTANAITTIALSPFLSAPPVQAQGIPKPSPPLDPFYTTPLRPTSIATPSTSKSSPLIIPPR